MPRGRPKGSRNKTGRGSILKRRSISKPQRVETKTCNKCGSSDHIRSTKSQCPKYFEPAPPKPATGTGKRGRPKGSKNKPKTSGKGRGKRGRPLGSKNKPKVPISALHNLSASSSSAAGLDGLTSMASSSASMLNLQPSYHGHNFSVLGLDGVEVGHQMMQIRRGRGRPLGSKNKPKKTEKRGRPKKYKDKSSTKSSSKSNKKRKARMESGYCNVCGSRDHIRSTRRQCPKHPEFEPPSSSNGAHGSTTVNKRMRSDSYDMPQDLLLIIRGDEVDTGSNADWSGRSGYRCEICGRRSENVGPRRGFDYRASVCGGCTDL